MDKVHHPVLLQEVLEHLNLAPGKNIVDCTVGLGGHAKAILQRIAPHGKLIGIDKDSDALKRARENLKEFKSNVFLTKGNFKDLKKIIESYNVGEIDGYLFDLGVSSLQLEEGARGFSLKENGPLDMRMDRSLDLSAGYLVNSSRESEIAGILRKYGEENFSGRIAKAIVKNRPLETTLDLAETIRAAVPTHYRYGRIHPATRTFQALRIAVNGELEALDGVLDQIPGTLAKGARACIISFHSLEDRIVKNRFREYGRGGVLKVITKKPIRPTPEEVAYNPRSRSAKMRAAERI
ncbi:MAG: 16S rRNA (cytosine(1402)-N(4))-methyltransferase RsmH [Candidatus Omnitrophota bacterium]